jgi:gas vesicle protein
MSASLAKISIINLCALSFIGACNSKEVVTDAQCSSEEQGMFLTCLESGCSASYTQDLSGTDACSIEGGGSLVSVEAGGECGFTSSGSCYVICDCPDGVGFDVNISEDSNQDSSSENMNSNEGLSELVYILTQKISEIESEISNIFIKISDLDEKDNAMDLNIADLESQIMARIESIEDANRIEVETLRSQIDNLNNQIVALNSEIEQLKLRADETDVEILSLNDRVTVIENSIIDINDDLVSLYDSVGLMISRYEVDCNRNNVGAFQDVVVGSWTLQNDNACILVEDVDSEDMPIVSVYQDLVSKGTEYTNCYNTYIHTTSPWSYCSSYYNYFDEFKVGTLDGGYSPGSGNPDDTWLGPGPYIRYDSQSRYLYTSSHYVSSTTNTTSYIYYVTVIGTKEYFSPQ